MSILYLFGLIASALSGLIIYIILTVFLMLTIISVIFSIETILLLLNEHILITNSPWSSFFYFNIFKRIPITGYDNLYQKPLNHDTFQHLMNNHDLIDVSYSSNILANTNLIMYAILWLVIAFLSIILINAFILTLNSVNNILPRLVYFSLLSYVIQNLLSIRSNLRYLNQFITWVIYLLSLVICCYLYSYHYFPDITADQYHEIVKSYYNYPSNVSYGISYPLFGLPLEYVHIRVAKWLFGFFVTIRTFHLIGLLNLNARGKLIAAIFIRVPIALGVLYTLLLPFYQDQKPAVFTIPELLKLYNYGYILGLVLLAIIGICYIIINASEKYIDLNIINDKYSYKQLALNLSLIWVKTIMNICVFGMTQLVLFLFSHYIPAYIIFIVYLSSFS